MDRKIRVVQYGVGKMSLYTMRYALEKGCEIVGAIDVNPELIGKDISELLGDQVKGVTITGVNDAEEMLKSVKPDIVVIETMNFNS